MSEEIVRKDVHSLLCCVRRLLNPLSLSVRRGCVSFRTDVSKFLFHGKGYQEARRRMYSYDLVDFPSVYFPSDWFDYRLPSGSAKKNVFPVLMFSRIRSSKRHTTRSPSGQLFVLPSSDFHEEVLSFSFACAVC